MDSTETPLKPATLTHSQSHMSQATEPQNIKSVTPAETPDKQSTIYCPLHTSQAVERVDPRPNTQKHLYCFECLLQSNDPKSLSATLQTIDRFLSTADIFYSTNSHKVAAPSEPPIEFSEVVSSQAENLEKLNKHIDREKKILENVFNEVTKAVIERINQKKNEYIQTLNNQVVDVRRQYNFFNKQLKRSYPTEGDLTSLFPSKIELEKRLYKAENFSDLTEFIIDIKEDINLEQTKRNVYDKEEDVKKEYFTTLAASLKDLESIKPTYETKNLNVSSLESAIKNTLERSLEKTLVLKNPIVTILPAMEHIDSAVSEVTYPQSLIIEQKDFELIREWFPAEVEFNPKLLYRGSKDGMSPSSFHSKCDKKGPTITLIKCQFKGAPQPSVIGGYLDQDWHKRNEAIISKEAFVFSVTTMKKCPILYPQFAAFGSETYGPTFGGKNGNFEVYMVNDFKTCSFGPGSYTSSLGIINPGILKKSEYVDFSVLEVEVYALN